MIHNIVDQNYRDSSYDDFTIKKANKDDPIYQLINTFFSKSNGVDQKDTKLCFEIGCYPGRYLKIFQDLGMIVGGIDMTHHMDRMINYFRGNGSPTGAFIQGEFPSKMPPDLYDVVFSCGFIEHFSDYQKCIKLHVKYVKIGGSILITTPNFAHGIQYRFHHLFDKENFDRHVIDSMNPLERKSILEDEGFELISYGYFGLVDLWFDKQPRNIIQRILVNLIMGIVYILKYLFKICNIDVMSSFLNSKYRSPYIFIYGVRGK